MVNEITIIDMSKPKNKNISNIDKFFTERMKFLNDNIKLIDATIKEYKTSLTEWYDKLYKTKKHTNESDTFKQVINIHSSDLRYYKDLKKQYLTEYTDLKKKHKLLHRALEERWMDGFAEGVRFIMDSYDTEEECE